MMVPVGSELDKARSSYIVESSRLSSQDVLVSNGCVMSKITLDFLQSLLKDEYPDVSLQHFESVPGSNRGDNYISEVYRITLKGIQRYVDRDGSSESNEPWESSLICKYLPESILRREAFKSDELFRNEVTFYTKIWPALLSFQKQWNVHNPFKSIPKYYLAENNCVVLQDLKREGYVMPERRQGLTVEQCYFVLKHLSQFHALSLAMKYHNPEALLNITDKISEVCYTEENINYFKNYDKEVTANAIAMVEQELADAEDKEVYLEKFRSFCSEDNFSRTMVEQVTPKEPLAVIGHGDCWTNNFLFKYVDGNIADMYMIDFQVVRYASPALDLAYLMYACLDRQQRAEHLSSLLEYYTDELHRRVLQMSDEDSVFNTSLNRDSLFKLVQEEFKCAGKFGLGIAIVMYPIMMCESDEAPDLYEHENQDNESSSTSQVQPVQTSSTACSKKLTDLIIELVDAEILT